MEIGTWNTTEANKFETIPPPHTETKSTKILL